MRARELRSSTPDALRARAEELARDISTLRFGGLEKEKNKKKLIALRHERARVLTILNERQQAAGPRTTLGTGHGSRQ